LISNDVISKVITDKNDLIYKVIVNITLPDSKEIRATISENGTLTLSKNNEVYIFNSVIVDKEKKLAYMNFKESFGKLSFDIDSFTFEVLDIIKVPIKNKKPQERSLCSGGRCCIWCCDWYACACAVECQAGCTGSCCCGPCCY